MARLLDELREAVPLARALQGLVERTGEAMDDLAASAASVAVPAPTVLGPDGRPATAPLSFGSSTEAAMAGSTTSAPSAAVSTGQGGGGGSRTGPRIFRSRKGGFAKTEEWVRKYGVPTTVSIPRPGNDFALKQQDYVEVAAWDCTAVLGPAPDGSPTIFIDPDAFQVLLQQRRPSISGRSGGGGASRGQARPEFNTLEGITTGPHALSYFKGELSAGPAAAPPGGADNLSRKIDEQTAVLREIRDQGRREAGSLARRAGGRP